MKSFLSKIWFPVAVVSTVAAQMLAFHEDVSVNTDLIGFRAEAESPAPDTVKYRHDGYKRGWTEDEKKLTAVIDDSLLNQGAVVFEDEGELDSMTLRFGPRPAGLDTIVAPDSLLLTDTFRYKYYPAIVDSLCHSYVRDTLIAFGDSLDYPRIDSLFWDNVARIAQEKYDAWYATLDKKGKKRADMERMFPILKARQDSIQAVKDSIQAYKDSVKENTPRILESFVLKDTMAYKRIVQWRHDRDFHNITISPEDTSFNYRIHDYPFLREDVNASWLGVAGSPVQTHDFTKRKSREGVSFYDAQESWSYDPQTLSNYNSKTPYTELAYFGTLLSGSSKESNNLHILTTQNISPSFNFCLRYDRFGGEGMLQNEGTINKNAAASANYLGKRYLMHAGYIYNMVSRKENGGVTDNTMIRDTTVDAREINVFLTKASSKIKKNTLYLDQTYRIPFTFIQDWKDRKNHKDVILEASEEGEIPELDGEEGEKAQAARPQAPKKEQSGEEDGHNHHEDEDGAPSDSLKSTKEVATAFIGHSSELSIYKRIYDDEITTPDAKAFYSDVFNYNPKVSHDSMRVMKFDNRLFIRLQPWGDSAAVSKLDVGVGEKLLNYSTFDKTFLHSPSSYLWNSTYAYAGAEGRFKKYFDWNAKAKYGLLGDEFGDMEISGNAAVKLYPFRRQKDSPMILGVHFETSLDEPEYYTQHFYSNHFAWENDFSKISDTRIQGSFSVPRWRLEAFVGYTLLVNNIYYGTDGRACQNTAPMSILTASLGKNFTVSKFHFDHRILAQVSSNEEVVPLPALSANFRYYVEVGTGDDKGGPRKPLYIQLGVDAWYNTAWYAPGWNPVAGVFHNQNEREYGNTPYFDAFMNMQWKRACIFVKWENAGMRVLPEKADYFSADHYIRTQRTMKVGIYWPFYTQPGRAKGTIPGADSHGHNH